FGPPPGSPLFPYTTLFRSRLFFTRAFHLGRFPPITFALVALCGLVHLAAARGGSLALDALIARGAKAPPLIFDLGQTWRLLTAKDRKSTRLNSSHQIISYA